MVVEQKNNETASLAEHQEALYKMLEVIDSICKKNDIKYMLFAGTMLGAVRHNGFIPWDDDLDIIMLREDYDKFMEVAENELKESNCFLQKEFSEHWPLFFSKLRMNNTTCLEKYYPKDPKCHQGIYIDIFPCDNAADSHFMRKVQYYASKIVIAKALDERGYITDSQLKKVFIKICKLLPQKVFVKIVKCSKKKDSPYVHSFFGSSSKFEKSIYKREIFTELVPHQFEKSEFPISAHYDELLSTLYGDYMQLPSEEDRKCKQHAILIDLNNSWEKYENYRDNMVFDTLTRSIR